MSKVRALLLAALLPLVGSVTASAHLTYFSATTGSRDFGIFTGQQPQTVSILNQTTKPNGWADGTDASFAPQDNQRYFRFTLSNTTTITLTVTALDSTLLLPAFSIYSGLGHYATDTNNPDYDGATVTQNYLNSLGGKSGAFDALHTWKIGNNDNPPSYTAELVTLVYMGNAADGTSANYGSASGINGDGTPDGVVSGSFTLPAGSYTVAIGGANYATADTTSRSFNATMSAVPEPSSVLLLLGGVAAWGSLRRRR